MLKLSIGILVLLAILFNFCSSNSISMMTDGDNIEKEERDLREEFMERREASEFFKRLLRIGKSKCEEQKREVRERFEEKCESVVPFQRLKIIHEKKIDFKINFKTKFKF